MFVIPGFVSVSELVVCPIFLFSWKRLDLELGLCRLRLETKACLCEQRCLGDPPPVSSSPLWLQQEQLPHHPSLRQHGEGLARGEERKYSQNQKCGGVGVCRSTTFQSRITVAACVGFICGQTKTSRRLKPPFMGDVSWLPKRPC